MSNPKDFLCKYSSSRLTFCGIGQRFATAAFFTGVAADPCVDQPLFLSFGAAGTVCIRWALVAVHRGFDRAARRTPGCHVVVFVRVALLLHFDKGGVSTICSARTA
ncbi:hypothetical protein [Methyloglobulus sp.]|uniref:hypothetical protein n=1 Tax=Methyloglobulus sp. TaxID=2518622 RepID=UPI0039890AAD